MIVFVSYSSTNREAVEALVLQLGELGHDVEYEVKFVGAPITWKHIFSNITNCDLFVTAVTRETLVSLTCEIEYQYARSLNKNILAVLLEDTSTEDLPDMKVKGLVDFRANTPDALAGLATAIAALPSPVPPSDMVIPPANWVGPLADLRKRIETLRRDPKEQRAVVLNIKEFLERRESFEVAKSLLDLLAAQEGLRQLTVGQIDYIRNEMWQVRASTRGARRQRTLVGAIILSSVVALIAVILSQLFFRFRANYNVELDMTRTAESVAADQANLQASVEAVDAIMTLQTTTPSDITATDNQLAAVAEASSPTPTVLIATNTPVILTAAPIVLPTQTLTPVVPTATLTPAIPTAAILPSYTPTFTPTQKPPTATATLTATSSPTQIPPTATATSTLTSTPTLGLSPIPANTRVVNGTPVLPQSVYVGLTVEDTPLGLKVTNVGDTAQSAGVQVGDYVLAVDLDIVTTRTQFLQTMQSRNPFSRITLRVRRADGINIITLVLGTNDFTLATPAQ